MIKKEMPERIYAFGVNDLPRWSASNVFDGAVEYVRSDVVLSDPKEPLKSGQFRWVRHKTTPLILEIAMVSVTCGETWIHETSGDAYRPDQYSYIGPVVMPTEEIENA